MTHSAYGSRHPARCLSYDELEAGLHAARLAGNVYRSESDDGLHLYCYTKQCVYARAWCVFTETARGVVLDPAARRVVATPFPKFFNAGEADRPGRPAGYPKTSFTVYEKVDGSLIALWHDGRSWRASTKGSFHSPQAKWAQSQLTDRDVRSLTPGTTYLLEAISPVSRIVVRYPQDELVLLAAYKADGYELSDAELDAVAEACGRRVAVRHTFTEDVPGIMAFAKSLPASQEGFVLRFGGIPDGPGGLRLKVKGDEYRRLHRLISEVTPLGIWNVLASGDDIDAARAKLPEDFAGDFDRIRRILEGRLAGVLREAADAAQATRNLSDKEVGLRLAGMTPTARRLVFPYRKNNGDVLGSDARRLVFRMIRPDGNRLDGYTPSAAIHLFGDDE